MRALWIGQQYYGGLRECVFIDDDTRIKRNKRINHIAVYLFVCALIILSVPGVDEVWVNLSLLICFAFFIYVITREYCREGRVGEMTTEEIQRFLRTICLEREQ